MRYTKHFFIAGFVFLSIAFTACKSRPKENKVPDDVIPVKVITLNKAPQQQNVFASGQFTTDDEAVLSFKNGGIIRNILVKEGDTVRKGQVLATLDVTEINAMSQQADIALQKAERDYQRAVNLYRDSVATLEQMQNAQTALEIARQQKVGVSFNRSSSEIRATQSGYVLYKFANTGQVVGPGTPVLQINGAASGNWVLKVGVSDNQWAAISVGDAASITSDAINNKVFHGKVIKKSEGIDPQSGTFHVQVQVTDSDKTGIAAGLFGKAEIHTTKTMEAWTIPFEALLDGNKNGGYVFISNDGKKARKLNVQVLRIENNKVVISSGLDSVKYLITSGNAYLDDGADIRIVP